MKFHNSCIPDNRVKIPSKAHPEIYQRWLDGETQVEIAADYKTTQPAITRICNKVEKKIAKEAQRKSSQIEILPDDILILGNFREKMEALPDNSIDLIFTDPPYDEKSIPLYGDLAKILKT